MKSQIKIELVPISGGGSLEPIIKVKINADTSDIRDYAIKTFFDTQAYDSNVLVVRRVGGGAGVNGNYEDLEIYPVKNLLVDLFDKEAGIPIADNTPELCTFLDAQKGISYTNDGKTIILFNIHNIWGLAVEYAKYTFGVIKMEGVVAVADNSDAFHEFLDKEGIIWTPNGHFTNIQPNQYTSFELGVKWEKYRSKHHI